MTTLTQAPIGTVLPTTGEPILTFFRMILKGISRFVDWIWPSEPDFNYEMWNQLENRRLLGTRMGEQMNPFPIR